MNELSLFTGAGGGVLGSKILGWKTVGYVEWDQYCQKVIAQRIKDGIFDAAPIFGDIRAFVDQGYAARYRGMVDIVSGGFPCQPFSVAGKRAGEADERNMWPATIGVIRAVRPRFAFLENSPNIINDPYFGTILGDLAEIGLDAEWDVFSACEVGASHARKRMFLVAYSGLFHRWLSTQSWIKNKTISDFRIGDKWKSTKSSKGYFQPRVWRTGNGMANRTNRAKAIGNGQVSLCMAYAYEILSRGIIEGK